MIQRTLRYDRLLLLLAAALLIASAFTIWQNRAFPASPSAGVMSEEPAGEWVTSSWPTTKYYTDVGDEATWRAWAAANRVWFDEEGGLLLAYPSRERKRR